MNFKVCVYAIAKDEWRNVDRFMESAREADYICVLDTGSSDGTVERLLEWALPGSGVIVERREVIPWRFDEARNLSLELIPLDTDICVSFDLDEVLRPGWREALETAWSADVCEGRYLCVCGRNSDGSPATSFFRNKVHRRGGFAWKYPAHEVLVRVGPGGAAAGGGVVDVPGMVAEHLPDGSKDRGGYLALLELGADENPGDARCAHYLGREYMYRGMWGEAIGELERHLALPAAAWAEERCASMRYLSECWRCKGRPDLAMGWARKALAELVTLRENWFACEKAAYSLGDWRGVVYYGEMADTIGVRSGSCISEADAWGSALYDYLSIGYWYMGLQGKALEAAGRALALNSGDGRIRANVDLLGLEVCGGEKGADGA